jgi:hypothetical protein
MDVLILNDSGYGWLKNFIAAAWTNLDLSMPVGSGFGDIKRAAWRILNLTKKKPRIKRGLLQQL